MKVSVIIPNYNHGRYLKKRIDSVLEQDYADFEVIILDDLSTDNSRQIIEKYRLNKKVSYIVYNSENSGSTFKQWKKGFELATGELIWIAESDDYADKSFLSSAVRCFIQDHLTVLTCSNSFLVNEAECVLQKNLDIDDRYKFGVEFVDGKRFIRKKMLYRNMIYNASAVVFKRDVLNSISMEYVNYRFCGDWLFWDEILCLGNIGRIYEKYNYFRQHFQKVTPRAESDGLDFSEGLKVFQNVIKKVDFSDYEKYKVTGAFFYRMQISRSMEKTVKMKVWEMWKRDYKYPYLRISIYLLSHFPVCIFNRFQLLCGRLLVYLDSKRSKKAYLNLLS